MVNMLMPMIQTTHAGTYTEKGDSPSFVSYVQEHLAPYSDLLDQTMREVSERIQNEDLLESILEAQQNILHSMQAQPGMQKKQAEVPKEQKPLIEL
jgi:hypothetical protein